MILWQDVKNDMKSKQEKDVSRTEKKTEKMSHLFKISSQIKTNRALYWAGIIQVVYGFFELLDTVVMSLIAFGMIPNFYSSLVSVETEIGRLMEAMPIIFVPIFAFITTFRILSGYWILKNKVKGFWAALFITGFSIVAVWFFLPLGALDLIIICPFVILLLAGYFQDDLVVQ